jgi:hypothetical protein
MHLYNVGLYIFQVFTFLPLLLLPLASPIYCWFPSFVLIGGNNFPQNLQTLLRILKQIDRFLQYDRLMPSYNGVVSISCIHTLKKLALRLSQVLPSERIKRLLQPFTGGPTTTRWQVRVAAMKALVDLEVQAQGLQAAVILAVHFMEADPSLRGILLY